MLKPRRGHALGGARHRHRHRHRRNQVLLDQFTLVVLAEGPVREAVAVRLCTAATPWLLPITALRLPMRPSSVFCYVWRAIFFRRGVLPISSTPDRAKLGTRRPHERAGRCRESALLRRKTTVRSILKPAVRSLCGDKTDVDHLNSPTRHSGADPSRGVGFFEVVQEHIDWWCGLPTHRG